MSDPAPTTPQPKDETKKSTPGPSLTLIYGLIALAMLAAIAIAAMVVLPFYHRR